MGDEFIDMSISGTQVDTASMEVISPVGLRNETQQPSKFTKTIIKIICYRPIWLDYSFLDIVVYA